jgi:hypothetical protein
VLIHVDPHQPLPRYRPKTGFRDTACLDGALAMILAAYRSARSGRVEPVAEAD